MHSQSAAPPDLPAGISSGLIKRAACALGLRRRPVGVSFFRTPEDYAACPARSLKTSMSYCCLTRLAGLGHGRKTRAAGISCPGALRALGFVPPDEDFRSGARYLSLGMYPDLDRARPVADAVSLLPGPMAGLAAEPLEACAAPPQVVIVIAQANAAMRLLQGYIHAFGPPGRLCAMGMQGLCAELTAHPHLTDSANISLLCSNTRFTCAWGEGEAGVAMPLSRFAGALEGVLATLDASESDAAKKTIAKRAARLGLDLPVTMGAAYYAPGRPAGAKPAAGQSANGKGDPE